MKKEIELLNNKEKVISGLKKINENEENISKAKKDIIENEKKLNSFYQKYFYLMIKYRIIKSKIEIWKKSNTKLL